MDGLTEMMERMGWTVPSGYRPRNAAVCRRCTHEVLWCWARGRRVPLNRDGSVHPWECRQRIEPVAQLAPDSDAQRCGYCPRWSGVRYSPSDLLLHIEARHPIARTLPLQT